jgi:hypothetical protein
VQQCAVRQDTLRATSIVQKIGSSSVTALNLILCIPCIKFVSTVFVFPTFNAPVVHNMLHYPTRFGAGRNYLQGVSRLTVRFSAQQLAVNTCPNVLVKCAIFQISRRSLVINNSHKNRGHASEDGADVRRNA